jgi:hypothetical protein
MQHSALEVDFVAGGLKPGLQLRHLQRLSVDLVVEFRDLEGEIEAQNHPEDADEGQPPVHLVIF